MNTNRKVFESIIFFIFIVYSIWYAYIQFYLEPGTVYHDYFTDSYGILAGFGGAFGLYISSKWGGFKSLVGKGIMFLSLGLLFQFLGQLSYSMEFYLYDIANSYPSYGEIFYFGSIPLYMLGVLNIAKASGATLSSKNTWAKVISVIIPTLMVLLSYTMFLQGYVFEDSYPLLMFLDFGYPIGQALYVSGAIVTYFLVKKFLGGLMRKRVLFVLFALAFQYAADSTFLHQVINETWYAGSFSDYLFLCSYFLMSLALIQLLLVLEKAKK